MAKQKSLTTSMAQNRQQSKMKTGSIMTAVGILLLGVTSDSFTLPMLSSYTRTRPSKTNVAMKRSSIASSTPSSPRTIDENTEFFLTPRHQDLLESTLSASTTDFVCNESTSSNEDDSFEIHLGRALDTLKKDYPHILTENPEFHIYAEDIEIVDPSGVKLHGVKNYRNAFRLMHAIVNVFYCPERSGLTFRLCYDMARSNIRIQWNAEVVPREIFGGLRTTLHVDGISVYEISQLSGKITQHRIERLLINDMPVKPQQGIVAALRYEHQSLPVFSKSKNTKQGFNDIVKFQQWNKDDAGKSLFSLKASFEDAAAAPGSEDSNETENITIDWEAYERKNASRKKFGLKPMTPEEFMEVEGQVRQLESEQQTLAAQMTVAKEEQKSKKGGFFDKLLKNTLKDTCESNFDCERPEICCDFGFKKMCCASGQFVFDGPKSMYGQPALVPVPVDTGFPQGGPGGNMGPSNY